MNKRDILFSSLVGSRVAKNRDALRAVESELGTRVPRLAGFLPFSEEPKVKKVEGQPTGNLWQADKPLSEEEQFFPLSFSVDNGRSWFLLPYEPFVSIAGKNTIIRRNVAKMKPREGRELGGTIKERWNQGDYEITITGALYGSLLTGSVEDCYPMEDFKRLRDFMTAPKRIRVKCQPLFLLGIDYIVIESFSFPFSKGENVQAYEIKAYSDFDYKLLLGIND